MIIDTQTANVEKDCTKSKYWVSAGGGILDGLPRIIPATLYFNYIPSPLATSSWNPQSRSPHWVWSLCKSVVGSAWSIFGRSIWLCPIYQIDFILEGMCKANIKRHSLGAWRRCWEKTLEPKRLQNLSFFRMIRCCIRWFENIIKIHESIPIFNTLCLRADLHSAQYSEGIRAQNGILESPCICCWAEVLWTGTALDSRTSMSGTWVSQSPDVEMSNPPRVLCLYRNVGNMSCWKIHSFLCFIWPCLSHNLGGFPQSYHTSLSCIARTRPIFMWSTIESASRS